MARTPSMKQASSSPKKEAVRSRRVTRLVAKKKSSINSSLSVKNASSTSFTRPIRKSSSVAKKQADKIVKSKGKNTSNTTSPKPVGRTTQVSKKKSDKVATVKGNKPSRVKKQPVVTTPDVQSNKKEELLPKARNSRNKKATSQVKNETTKKKETPSPTNKKVSRQISLKESFSNQSNSKRLRPRRVVRNYCDNSVASEKNESGSNLVRKERVPIYKSIPIDDPVNNTSEVYDFKFDKDDSRERIKKKKKRTAKPTVVQKLMKARAKLKLKENMAKAAIPPAEEVEEINVEEVPEIPKQLVESKETAAAVVIQETTPEDPSIVAPVVTQEIAPEDQNAQDEEDANKENLHAPQTSNTAKETAPNAKPLVTSVENLRNKRVTIIDNAPSPLSKEDFKPFRPTNIFNSKLSVPSKSMLNHSLLEKSLSPIVNTIRTFDVGSPWRAPPLSTFSQVKNLYQSTPQRPKLDTPVNKFQRATNEMKNYVKSSTPIQKQTNTLGVENTQFLNNQKKTPVVTARRFGTEITNIDKSLPVYDQSVDLARTAPITETPVFVPETVNTNHNVQDTSVLKENTDAQNNILAFQTPKKAGKIKLRKAKSGSPIKRIKSKEKFDKENVGPTPGPSGLQNRSPLKERSEKENSNKENMKSTPEASSSHNKSLTDKSGNSFDKTNLEPVAGPSGLQKSGSPGEQRILRQSNLNNYLNLMDMPESINITTPHGIFGDMHSAPVSSKSLKKTNESKAEIQNAFGFIEDITDENIPRTEQYVNERNNRQPILRKDIVKDTAPARLSIREIKNHLIVNHNQDGALLNKKDQDTNTKANRSPLKHKPNPIQDIANFSDTFDVLSEAGELTEDTSQVPLFADLEPSHFREPPKHSYKRKRGVHFSFSDDSDSENDEVHKVKPKRRKGGKLSKLEEKRLKAWVQDVNKTFEEIDHYDLIVE